MAQVYRLQASQGRWFLHEHPEGASSWAMTEIKGLLDVEDVAVVSADQCMFGLTTWAKSGKMSAFARKRTRTRA